MDSLPPTLSSEQRSIISSDDYGVNNLGSNPNLILPESKGLWFNNQELYLDGWKFISCRFDNCKLYVTTGNFIIERCYIDDTNVVFFGGAAVKIIRLFNRDDDHTLEKSPGFAAKKDIDGTLSIGA